MKPSLTEHVETLDSPELTVLPSSAFYPFRDWEIYDLWTNQTDEEWETKFAQSYMVHFYGSATKTFNVSNNEANTAYKYLGPRYCPDSYLNTENFRRK